MSLISLLIALATERYLSSNMWQFNNLYQRYMAFIDSIAALKNLKNDGIGLLFIALVPSIICCLLLSQIHNVLLYLIVSTLILIVCFGCIKTRQTYKNYLISAFRGELTTCQLHQTQLQQDKNLTNMNFAQSLIWLNYRYYIAVIIFFIVFGPAGALFYRLITAIEESQIKADDGKADEVKNDIDMEINTAIDEPINEQTINDQQSPAQPTAETTMSSSNNQQHFISQCLFILDCLPVRLVSLGYMFVGHFSKALPVWLEHLLDFNKAPCEILINVAQHSEDFTVDKEDCTAEPCLLVKLAKRTLLLFMALIALLVLMGLIR